MDATIRYVANINLGIWILSLLLFHGILYLLLGTEHWFFATITATGTWTLVLLVLRAVGRIMNRQRDTA